MAQSEENRHNNIRDPEDDRGLMENKKEEPREKREPEKADEQFFVDASVERSKKIFGQCRLERGITERERPRRDETEICNEKHGACEETRDQCDEKTRV